MEKDIIKPKTLPGFMELLPDEQILFNEMKQKIQNSYEKFGFLPLDTPIIESADILLAKAGGETEKQIYRFTKGENDLALRFDLTVPLAKYVTEYYQNLSFPFRRYQIGKVYRGEKAQRGRFREFYQCDIDIIGDGELNIINDAELPSVIYNTFKELGFDKFTICINNRKLLNGLFESCNLKNQSADILRAIDKIDKIGKESVVNEIKKLGIEEDKINLIMKFISINTTVEDTIEELQKLNIQNETFSNGLLELQELVKYIKIFGVPEGNFKIDLTIARGLDYYTGTVYETFLDEYRFLGSVCSGGRYDNLAEYYTDKKLPGVGISIGLSRLFFQLTYNNIIKPNKKSTADVLVISMIEDLSKPAEIATILRNNGINTQIYVEKAKIKKQFKYANSLEVPYVIVLGEDEIKNGTVSLKNMETGEQCELTIDEVVSKFWQENEKNQAINME
ncbi:MAG: histidine--tRNA ligase [Clostridia bacterium]|nr:histidine--tRNA ligase [Clostridia bacterium]